MSLAARQQAFMTAILDEDAALPELWTARQAAGLDIYRNNYRSALVEALATTFERTQRWVGEEAFRRAAAHHLILHPPSSWTLDDAGKAFDDTLAELFPGDPEVAELAWLEWAMHRAFSASDSDSLGPVELAEQTAAFGEDDWTALGFVFVPALAQRQVTHDLGTLWKALGADDFAAPDIALPQPHSLAVWREAMRPTFRLLDPLDGEVLAAAMAGASFGTICLMLAECVGEQEGVVRAGALLRLWLQDGLIAALRQT